jgi:hypothetical protein
MGFAIEIFRPTDDIGRMQQLLCAPCEKPQDVCRRHRFLALALSPLPRIDYTSDLLGDARARSSVSTYSIWLPALRFMGERCVRDVHYFAFLGVELHAVVGIPARTPLKSTCWLI